MKIRVISEFYDKFHTSTLFKVGTVLDFDDDRAKDVIAKKLAVPYSPEPKAEAKTETPAQPAKEEKKAAETKPEVKPAVAEPKAEAKAAEPKAEKTEKKEEK